jgi:hypothetical protein
LKTKKKSQLFFFLPETKKVLADVIPSIISDGGASLQLAFEKYVKKKKIKKFVLLYFFFFF